MKKFLILIILVIFTQSAYSQWEQRAAKFTPTKFVYKEGKLYIGRTNGLTELDMATKKPKQLSTINSALPGNFINSFVEMPDKSYLIATDRGLAIFENGIITTNKPICKEYPDLEARRIVIDNDGSLWTFSAHKIHKYTNGKWVSYDLGKYIKSNIGISKLYCFDKEVWFLSNEISAQPIGYYFSNVSKYRYYIGILRDTGVVKVFQNVNEYPYSQNNMSLAQINEGILLWNGDSTYLYRNSKWEKTNILDIDSNHKAAISYILLDDNKGNIWYSVSGNYGMYPVSFNKSTGKKTEYIKERASEYFNIVDTMNNGEIFFLKFKGVCININNNWTTFYPKDFGFSEGTIFNAPFKIEDKYYITVLFDNAVPEQNGLQRGTIICLNDSSRITLDDDFFPFSSISSFGINKEQKGVFKGVMLGEYCQYEADSAFVGTAAPYQIKTSSDGHVYFNNYTSIETWEGNDLKDIDMGFSKNPDNRIIDFDVSGDLVVALGYYEYATDSLNSYVSFYNSKTGSLDIYDKNNSLLPDFYRVDVNGSIQTRDTVPSFITADDKGNAWIKTSASLIKLNKNSNNHIELSKNRFSTNNFYYDKTSNQILIFNYIDKIFFYDINKDKWDSTSLSETKITGIKKLSNNKVYAINDSGFFYQHTGNGKFKQIDLQIPGKTNFGTPINDFCLDANNYLHFGTYSGIFTNKYIFNCGNDNFVFTDFSNSSDIVFNVKAKADKNVIKLTEPKPFEYSSIYYKNPMVISGGFSTEFSFRFYNGFNNAPDGSPDGADGITFIMQGNISNETGNGGGGLGYDGISNSLVIEYDSFKNIIYNDPDGSHIAVFTNGTKANSNIHNEKANLGTTSEIPLLKADSTIYYSKIEYNYDSKKLSIWLDTTNNFENPVLVTNSVDIASLLNLIEGNKAFVGFTSATGDSYQSTELLSWSLCPSNDNSIISSVKESDFSENSDEVIFPNPASDYIEINVETFNPTLKHGVDEGSDIQIFDILGVNVSPAGGGIKGGGRIDISNLAPGMYFIKIGNRVEKFVKM
jgi:hypothetical protein